MIIPEINDVVSADQATSIAQEWQVWGSEEALSYAELADWEAFFIILAEKFPELRAEFVENGIISPFTESEFNELTDYVDWLDKSSKIAQTAKRSRATSDRFHEYRYDNCYYFDTEPWDEETVASLEDELDSGGFHWWTEFEAIGVEGDDAARVVYSWLGTEPIWLDGENPS